ncbi:MAG: hypothetical protein KA204_07515 [Chromatiaceae bacterium]|nr:hypothetical protein [Chromatiaceae bacterium]MBP6733501.1 hypothetical protein [Chromatiaceae bacterium]MBP6806927.1 hypothetical protein [Chromatiaceae bacterium]MBP8288427.1 hypothetical protein [Chromatiaceae bacterium]MBP9602745.1 hypothetical protein [Chromatiaceae bacterium]
MRKTAHIAPTWWLSESRRQLAKRGPTHLAAWAAICTGPLSHVSGVCYLPGGELAGLIGISTERAAKILVELETDGLLALDRAQPLVWLVGVIEMQLGSPRWWANEKWLTATISYLESLPASPVIEKFLAHYGLTERIARRYSSGYPIGGVFQTENRVSLRGCEKTSWTEN